MGNFISPKSLKTKQKEYENKLTQLKQENEKLKQELETISKVKQVGSKLSKERLKQLVEKMIKDDDINIDYLPDFVERKIYTNVFNILINLLDETLETTGIDLLGHKIKLDLVAE